MNNDDAGSEGEQMRLPHKKVRRPMHPRKRVVQVKGKDHEVWMYTAGAVAAALNRTAQTIRLWERNGQLPQSTYRDDRGRRLYTADQVAAIMYVFKTNPRISTHVEGEATPPPFSWEDSPIPQKLKELWDGMPEGIWLKNVKPPWEVQRGS